MKLTIFGGTGVVGTLLMRKALARDHEVITYVPSPLEINFKHTNLIIVQGDINDMAGIRFATKQADAVISMTESSPDDLLVTTAKNIITAMKANNVKRLIWPASTSVRATQDEPTLRHRIIFLLLKWLSRKEFKSTTQASEIIKGSALDWTIARAPWLTDEPGHGDYHISYVAPEMGPTLSRENYAAFILHLVESGAWVRDLPVASDR